MASIRRVSHWLNGNSGACQRTARQPVNIFQMGQMQPPANQLSSDNFVDIFHNALVGIASARSVTAPVPVNPTDTSGECRQTARCKTFRTYSHLRTAQIPMEPSDMRHEEARLQSFRVPGTEFASSHLVSIKDLAADGFFYLQEADNVKCAFCGGVIKDWKAGDQVRRLHRCKFPECPFVLYMDVGNVPKEPADAEESLAPVQCSDESHSANGLMVSDRWSAALQVPDMPALLATDWKPAVEHPRPPDSCHALMLDSAFRSGPAVSADVARAACSESSLSGLQCAAPHAGSRHPQFASIAARLQSLHSASEFFQQPVDSLANAGFFCSSDLTVTCCFSCGLQMRHWSRSDDAWVEHARWAPRCPHLLLERGCKFVLLVHARVPPVMSTAALDRPSNAGFKFTGPGETLQALVMTPGVAFRVEARDLKARVDSPVQVKLRQLGFTTAQLRLSTELYVRRSGDDFASPELFLDFLLREVCQIRPNSQPAVTLESHLRSKIAVVRGYENQKPRSRNFADWKTCKVCRDKETNAILLDCGHLFCTVCTRSLLTCPACKQWIRGIVCCWDSVQCALAQT